MYVDRVEFWFEVTHTHLPFIVVITPLCNDKNHLKNKLQQQANSVVYINNKFTYYICVQQMSSFNSIDLDMMMLLNFKTSKINGI
jgi:hypothetical protein